MDGSGTLIQFWFLVLRDRITAAHHQLYIHEQKLYACNACVLRDRKTVFAIETTVSTRTTWTEKETPSRLTNASVFQSQAEKGNDLHIQRSIADA
jgi:hypothetical protein